jgi:hypothetical protein
MGQATGVRHAADKPEPFLILEQRGTSAAALSFPASSSQSGPCVSAMHAQRYGDIRVVKTWRMGYLVVHRVLRRARNVYSSC